MNYVAKFGLPSPTRTRTPTPTKTITPTQTPTATATSNCTTRPPKPTLAAPPNNATLFTLRPRLKWNAAACALSYKVIVKNAATGQVADKVVSYTKLKYRTDPLQTNVLYKWFVQACNPFGCTKSAKRTLTLQ